MGAYVHGSVSQINVSRAFQYILLEDFSMTSLLFDHAKSLRPNILQDFMSSYEFPSAGLTLSMKFQRISA